MEHEAIAEFIVRGRKVWQCADGWLRIDGWPKPCAHLEEAEAVIRVMDAFGSTTLGHLRTHAVRVVPGTC